MKALEATVYKDAKRYFPKAGESMRAAAGQCFVSRRQGANVRP